MLPRSRQGQYPIDSVWLERQRSLGKGVAPTALPTPLACRSGRQRCIAPGSALAVLLFQVALADADRNRGDFNQLIFGDEFHGVFQVQLDRRSQDEGLILAGSADVGQLLRLGRVHHEIVLAAMDADDHALVELLTVAHEHATPLLEVEQGVGDRLALLAADQHAVVAIGYLTLHRREAVENVADEAGAAGEGHELALEADQATR